MANPGIAVINFTTTLQDDPVRTAIHAVNRHVEEQFQPISDCGRTLNAGRWQMGLIDTSTPHQTAEVVSSGSVPAVGQPGRHRALLVEDHAALAEATAELMRLHGLQVRVAATGGDALKTAEEFNPVLILCDLMLRTLYLQHRPAAEHAFVAADRVEAALIERALPRARRATDSEHVGFAAVRVAEGAEDQCVILRRLECQLRRRQVAGAIQRNHAADRRQIGWEAGLASTQPQCAAPGKGPAHAGDDGRPCRRHAQGT